MSKITVTAQEGQTAKVTVQQHETITRVIPEVRDSNGALLEPAGKQEFKSWADKEILGFATESRNFDVGPGQRLIVEGQ